MCRKANKQTEEDEYKKKTQTHTKEMKAFARVLTSDIWGNLYTFWSLFAEEINSYMLVC